MIDNKGGTRIAGIFNEARETSSGNLNTGQIKIIANELSLINGQAQIQSFSASKAATPKPASKVDILVRNLFVDGGEGFGPGDGAVGIFSESLRNGFGGIVKVVAQEGITLRNFGQIATNVSDVLAGQTGKAGTVIVEAKTIDIVGIGIGDKDKTGISSSAGVNSLGHPGTVSIKAKDWIHVSNTGAIAIRSGSTTAAATNQPTTLTISASNIELNNGRILSSVSGEDSGGRIVINAGNQLKLTNGSSITSEATDGNGGPIVINAENSVRLRNSKITSSVTGKVNGNGGDIDIGGKVLVMESGFIQANTTAPSAQGGKVNISVQRLVANGGNAFIGGTKIQDQVNDVVGFNVIQAAAPEGVAGNLLIANPEFDISGTLLGLALPAELGALSQDLCEVGANSSFTSLGRITSHSSSKDPISP